jgi:hypothetical protein
MLPLGGAPCSQKIANGPMNMALSKKKNEHTRELIYESQIRIV